MKSIHILVIVTLVSCMAGCSRSNDCNTIPSLTVEDKKNESVPFESRHGRSKMARDRILK